MTNFLATTLAVTLNSIGVLIGAALWAAIGWCLGSAFSHAPITGALTGLAYQLWSCIYLRDQLAESIERNISQWERLLSR